MMRTPAPQAQWRSAVDYLWGNLGSENRRPKCSIAIGGEVSPGQPGFGEPTPQVLKCDRRRTISGAT